jgi:hypothetical protein
MLDAADGERVSRPGSFLGYYAQAEVLGEGIEIPVAVQQGIPARREPQHFPIQK